MGASEPYQINPTTAQQWRDRGYEAGLAGGVYDTSPVADWEYYSYYDPYGRAGYQQGKQEYEANQMMQEMRRSMEAMSEGFELPAFEAPEAFDYEGYYQQQADAQLEAQRAAEERARMAAEAELLRRSTEQVDAEIANERSRAKLLGLEYDISPEKRRARIDATVKGGGPQEKKRKKVAATEISRIRVPTLIDEEETLGQTSLLGAEGV